MSFTQFLNPQLIGTAIKGYNAIILDVDKKLTWPTDFQVGDDVVAAFMNITPIDNGRVLTLPDATHVSVGYAFVVNNTSDFDFTLASFTGLGFFTITAGNAYNVVLNDNSISAGQYTIFPYGGGAASVQSIGINIDENANDNLTVVGNPGNPLTSAGTFTLGLAQDLATLTTFGTDTGFPARADATHWTLRKLLGTGNQIDIADGDGNTGNPTFSLPAVVKITTQVTAGNISISGNDITAIDLNGGVTITPSGDGTGNITLSTALGSGNITFTSPTGGIVCNANMGFSTGHGVVFSNTTGSFSVGINASTASANYIVQLPPIAPVTGQALVATTATQLNWVNIPDLQVSAQIVFDGTDGGGVINASNATVERTGVGEYIITFTIGFANTFYRTCGAVQTTGFIAFNATSTTTLRVTTFSEDGTATDFNPISVWCSAGA